MPPRADLLLEAVATAYQGPDHSHLVGRMMVDFGADVENAYRDRG